MLSLLLIRNIYHYWYNRYSKVIPGHFQFVMLYHNNTIQLSVPKYFAKKKFFCKAKQELLLRHLMGRREVGEVETIWAALALLPGRDCWLIIILWRNFVTESHGEVTRRGQRTDWRLEVCVCLCPPSSLRYTAQSPSRLTDSLHSDPHKDSPVLSPRVSTDLVIVTEDCRHLLLVLGGHAFGQGEDRAKELTPWIKISQFIFLSEVLPFNYSSICSQYCIVKM